MGSYTTISRWRFPVLFIGILGLLQVGFSYRKSFMQDLKEKKAALEKENEESKQMLASLKDKAMRTKEGEH